MPRRTPVREQWLALDEFPNYAVNRQGEIINLTNGAVLRPRPNQRGVLMIGLVEDGIQKMRSVALLVAKKFLDPPEEDWFDTVLHRDGQKANCHADNLLWRPRWFVIEYHRQFDRYTDYKKWKAPLIELKTGKTFSNPREASYEFGVLEKEVIQDLHRNDGVYPGGLQFRYAD
jgi:hypothetical protein